MEVVKPFELESPVRDGVVPERVLHELELRKDAAKRTAKMYADAVEEQAKKYGARKAALNRLVSARVSDKVGDLARENESLTLMMSAGV